uniref:RNase H type-1 domain-containing protein n=1 Tax=Vitis vinifera TaxID=29760 RepID=A5BL54_VITVI|nr:hypothetical protein VITISV_001869 [Vitis vinifera]
MPRIHPLVASYRLNFHLDRQKIIQNEVDKLLAARFIREVEYPDWLANVVVVPKKEGKWREKIAFIMSHGLYCYKVMPFKLKNAGATYQRLMTKIFKPLISHTVEVYIDDIVVKSKFLGFMVTHRGIEVSLDQVKAVMETSAPKSKIRAVTPHRQTHCLGTLHSPIHRQTETLLPCVEGSRCNRIDGELPVRKLRPYFQAHPIVVLTNQPLRSILHKPDLSEIMLKWAIELSEYGIEYQPRLSIKGQVMVDFIVETLQIDGASRSSGSGVGLLLRSPIGEQLEQPIRLGFPASNNEAEYEAIISRLNLALAFSAFKLKIYNDSQLIMGYI